MVMRDCIKAKDRVNFKQHKVLWLFKKRGN
jgi:hypothetical protein